MRWPKKLKVLKCYLFMLGWLGVLLLGFSYWKIDGDNARYPGPLPRKRVSKESNLLDDKPRHKRPRIHCNLPDRIKIGHEGEIPLPYELSGVIILLRHGDRGPLMEVKNMSNINCGYKSFDTPSYKTFVSDILNASKTNTYINFVGPFMKFPLLPPPSRCSVSQLTPMGVTQHLQLGKVLSQLYVHKFKLISHPWDLEDFSVYSTKYRRTFQSALAFIHAFLPSFDLVNIRLKEAKGINFCHHYCKCDKANFYDKKHEAEKIQYRISHPSIMELISDINPVVKSKETAADFKSPSTIRDALLAYACHGSKLPCSDNRCVTFDDLAKVLAFEEWEAKQKRTSNQVKAAKLKTYGFLKSIYEHIESIMTSNKPKVTIYSGHDKSISYLLTSLGISHFVAPHYSARVIIELYFNTSVPSLPGMDFRKNYHFRLVYNGKDITKLIPFCNVKFVKQIDSGSNSKLSQMALCKVSSFEKFMKPTVYFKEFNATSFTSACVK